MKIRSKRLLLFLVACLMLLQTVSLPTMAAEKKYETIRVEAENFLGRPAGDGIDLSEDDGSQVVTELGDTDVLSYSALDFGPEGVNKVNFRAKFGSSESKIEVRLDRIDGPLVGTMTSDKVTATDKWLTVEADLDGVTEEHDIFLAFYGDIQLNWFEFTKVVPFDPNLILWFTSDCDRDKSRLDISTRPNGGVGHDVVGHNDAGELFVFSDVDFSPVTTKIALSFAKGDDVPLTFDLRLDSDSGPVAAHFVGKNTGGYDNFMEVVVDVGHITGTHDIYFNSSETSDLAYLRLQRLEEYDPAAEIEAAPDTTILDEAKQRLGNLEIMIGDEGGFREEDSLTRAEATKVIICMMGLGSTAASTEATSRYTDMAADHWANPYVNLATDMGIVAGMGNGEFWADTPLTNEQALKMVLHAGGYESMAAENGGYPLGYVIAADDIGLTYGMELIGNEKATRGDFAIIVNRMIETPMMVAKSTSKGTYVVSGESGTTVQTLLKNYLKTDAYDATVTKVESDKITLRTTAAIDGSDKSKVGKTFTFKKADMDLFFTPAVGEEVVLCLKNQDYISMYRQDESSAIYDYVYAVNGDTSEDSLYNKKNISNVTLYLADEIYDVADNLKLYYKGEAADEAVSLTGSYVKATMDGSTITRLDVYPLTEGGIVTSKSETSLRFTRQTETYTLSHLDEADELLVTINGRIATLDDIESEMLVDYCKFGDNYMIVASGKMANGTVTQILDGGDKIAIDTQRYWTDDVYGPYTAVGKSKEFKTAESMADLNKFMGKSVSCYVAPNGKIRYIWSRTDNSTFYGAIDKIWLDGDQYMNVYNLEADDGQYTADTYAVNLKNSEVQFEELEEKSALMGRRDTNQVYKFTLNSDGEISKIENVVWIVRNRPTADNANVSEIRFNVYDAPANDTYGYVNSDGIDDDAYRSVDAATGTPTYYSGNLSAPDASIVVLDSGLPTTKMEPRKITWNNLQRHIVRDSHDPEQGRFAVSAFADPTSPDDIKMFLITDGVETIGWMDSAGAVINDVYTYNEDYTTVEILRGNSIETYNLVNSAAYGVKQYMPIYYVHGAFSQPNFSDGILIRAYYDIENDEMISGAGEGDFNFAKDVTLTKIAGSYYLVETADGGSMELIKDGTMVVYEREIVDYDSNDEPIYEYTQESFDNLSVGDVFDVAFYSHEGLHTTAIYYDR